MRAHWLLWTVVLLPGFFAVPAEAWEFQYNGHFKQQFMSTQYRHNDVNAAAAGRYQSDQEGDARLNLQWMGAGWRAEAAYQFLGVLGNKVTVLRNSGTTNPVEALLPVDKHRLFDLTRVAAEGDYKLGIHRLDRLVLGYSSERAVVRMGRQTANWGNGLIFHVLDIFSPFSLGAIDKDYKAGDDMVYGQWLRSNGDDAQFAWVPRRNENGGRVTASQSSIVGKYHGRHAETEYDLVAARHYGEAVLGAGLSRDWALAVWRFDLGVTRLDSSHWALSLLANVDRSWTLRGKNVYGFLEYFHNGFGVEQGDYSSPGSNLEKRLLRHELFTVARDYVAMGGRVEWHPRVNQFLNLIVNLQDAGRVAQFYLNYDLGKDLLLTVGATWTLGGRGTEFGGITSEGHGLYNSAGDQVFIKAGYFF